MTSSIIGYTPKGALIEIDQSERREQLYVIGTSGTGKSTLLRNLILQDIRDGLGVAVLDPHGSLIESVLWDMNRLKNPRYEDIIYLDLTNKDYLWGMNLFQCSDISDMGAVENTINQVMTLLNKVYGITHETPHMYQFFLNLTQTFIYNPPHGFLDIPRLFSDKDFVLQLAKNVPNIQVSWFWRNFFENKSKHQQTEDYNSIINKLDEFFRPVLKTIFGQQTSTIDFREIMDEGKIVFCRLHARRERLTKITGTILVATLLDAAYSRQNVPITKRKQFNAYFHEFQWFDSSLFAQLYSEARKYDLACTISHQVLEQVEDTSILATCQQAKSIFCFRVSGNNASMLANQFDITPPPPPVETKRESYLIPKQDVLNHILQHGHTSKEVTEFVSEYVRRIFQASQEPLDYTQVDDIQKDPQKRTVRHTITIVPHGAPEEKAFCEYGYLPDTLKKALSNFNELLYLYNAQTYEDLSDEEFMQKGNLLVGEVSKDLSGIIGFYHYAKAMYEPVTSEGRQALSRIDELNMQHLDTLITYIRTNNQEERNEKYKLIDKIIEQRQECYEILEHGCLAIIASALRKQQALDDNWDVKNITQGWFSACQDRDFLYHGNYKNLPPSTFNLLVETIFTAEQKRHRKFKEKLTTALGKLESDPIMIESDKYEEKPISHQTHTDKQQEIANMLSQLPNLTTYARIGGKIQYCWSCGNSQKEDNNTENCSTSYCG